MIHADVVVIGAGAAGVAAAHTAARSGARVVCIEKESVPGGNATVAAVGTICGLYPRMTTRLLESEYLHRFVHHVQSLSESKPITQKQGLSFLPYRIPDFVHACYTMLDLPQIQYLGDAVLVDVLRTDERIESIDVMASGDCLRIVARQYIDASGDALLSRLGNVPCLDEERHQAAAMVFSLGMLPSLEERSLIILMLKVLEHAHECGHLEAHERMLSLVPGSVSGGQALFKLAVPYDGVLTPSKKTSLEMQARKSIFRLLAVLSRDRDLQNCSLLWIASSLGVRSGARGAGCLVLREADVREGKQYEDEVARGVWPIEVWSKKRRPEMIFFEEESWYSIRAGMVTSKYCQNLFFAGRTLSGEERALGSARVLGTAMLTGEAAATVALQKSLEKGRRE